MKMLKIMIATVLVAFLCACEPSEPKEEVYILPDELKHCTVYSIDSRTSHKMNVLYCPKQPTTTSHTESCGKSCIRTVTTSVVHGE